MAAWFLWFCFQKPLMADSTTTKQARTKN